MNMKLKQAVWMAAAALALTALSVGVGIHGRRTAYTPPGRVIKIPPADITAITLYKGPETLAAFTFDKPTRQWRFDAPAQGIRRAAATIPAPPRGARFPGSRRPSPTTASAIARA